MNRKTQELNKWIKQLQHVKGLIRQNRVKRASSHIRYVISACRRTVYKKR
ncbi:hypothetical protein [Paenibacillus sp. BIHB 4019]|nr:hypothetical protein [Paenibacillus sp. BIHB 4019]